ncbi:alpha/beta hydrolase [Crocosphaera sp. XPORK-15E]|uniref:alpha/beta hydrolase n=1 Tax=Crocosphaera sp. XPORK-15E TaxID=3110247 RepID=UPI002B204148|nr:alpha/beta hydrolase [Crocosphaera sp. XPORK-15E]MEA5534995.1 alpha/beta hydrolase [Crocosphaera sp. XPORK-15E]
MMTNLLLKGLLSGVGIGAIAYICACLALVAAQNRLIFKPISTITTTPTDLGLNYEDVWLSVLTPQGKVEKIHGWWIRATSSSQKVLLYLHGNGGNISYNLGPIKSFQEAGFSVLIIDYRGYGRSQGDFPTESEIYRDAQVAWDYLIEQRKVKPQNIFLYGHSLGGAVAIDLGVRKPQAAGIIVENTFTSMRDMMDYLGSFYQLFPADLILHQRFDSLSKLRLLQIPLLLIHGTSDRTVPAYMSERLFKAATVPKKLFLVPNANHNNVGAIAGEDYEQVMQEFSQLVRNNQRQLALER